jgi:glycogen debranching enzyme
MARYFDGFRMDNLHGTQLNVASYMIKEARKVNPGLIVFAELFTSNDSETATFVRKVGINSMLKEAQHLLSGPSLIHYFHRRV